VRQDAAQLLFISCLVQRSRNTVFSCYNVTPLSENYCSTSLFTLDIKALLKEDARFFDRGWVDWWAACENDAAGGLLSYARD
jgi:hypothetical protein